MVMVRAFRAVRPDKNIVHRVAELPYDTMNTEEAREIAKDNKFSYLRIDKAEIELPPDTDIHSIEVYEKAGENLRKFMDEKIFIQDEEPHLYIYREIMDGRSQIGIVGCVSVHENRNGKIKKHEHTKPDKVEDRINHIKHCGANTGTILLTYEKDDKIEEVVEKNFAKEPEYDFTSDDGIRHTVWVLDDVDTNKIENAFKNVDSLYIADGHHRSKAAEEYAFEQIEKNPNLTGEEEYNFYLAMIAPKENLYVMDYNRVVSDLNGMEVDEFINKIEDNFEVFEVEGPYRPQKKNEFGMYVGKKWYRLDFKGKNVNLENTKDVIASLDVSTLHDYIINPILDIKVPQKDKRIDFIGGIRGLNEIEKRVNDDMKIGFTLYPTSIDELMKVADAGEVMPAKSTWFEPKVRCGIFLHLI